MSRYYVLLLSFFFFKQKTAYDMRISDWSSDVCSSDLLLARGTADKAGRLAFPSALPEPETYSSCEENPDMAKSEGHALMVSARAEGDFSFTLTDWGDGIRPYDFDLPYGWSERSDILHTIFDRALVKAGETVHMKIGRAHV